ncbi:hypothetical protein GCM10022200_26860 [Microbacterium awajiense]|uniref:Uncharacterized protein n=1 Tax=Microbacterium awajiense TaxID=415214 RepID=A0ABP7AX35_9MICO
MSFREKSAWAVMGVLAVIFGGYAVAVAQRVASVGIAATTVTDVAVWAVIGTVVLLAAVHITMAAIAPPTRGERTSTDGRRAGYAILAAGAVIAFVLTLTDAAPFWVANALITALVAGEITSAAAWISHERRNARTQRA